MLERFPHLENKNVEPSAQFSGGDASDRLPRGSFGAGGKSRRRQEPFPDFRGHLLGMPQELTGSAAEGPRGSLPGFLRQHYTTGGQMAAVLSAYLIANGAADRRLPDGQPKPGTDAKPDETKPGSGRPPGPQAAAGRAGARGCQARRRAATGRETGCRWIFATGRAQGPQAAGATGRGAGRRQAGR